MSELKTQPQVDISEELRQLVKRGEAGDQSVLPRLRQLLEETPDLWKKYGDLADLAQTNWLDLICGVNLAFRESLLLKLADLKQEIGDGNTTPLDRLLVARITASWLQVSYAECHLAQLRQQKAHDGLLRVVERFLDRSHHRYITAIKQLANVRKLLKPALSPLDLATRQVPEAPAKESGRLRKTKVASNGIACN